MATYPQKALQPGQKGPEVKQLQDYLVSRGYMTTAQVNTGPGIYGPKTKAAVAKLQSDFGVETAGYSGYWGPKTMSKLTEEASQGTKATDKPVDKPPVTDETVDKPPVTDKPVTPGDVTKPVPETMNFKNSNAYKALSQEAKNFVDIGFNVIEFGREEEARMFSNAIEQAQAIAEPYYKTQLSLALAEVMGAIATQTQDYEAKRDAVQRARDQLTEDISRNKEFLTLEQQAEISREIRSYDEDLLTIADQAAEKGLTFATGARSRSLAESRRGEQQQDVVQSSRRQYNFQVKELELKASRGDVEAQKQLADLQARQSFGMQQIGRSAEQVLGSANLPSITGFTPVGGAMGSIEEKKRKSMLSDVYGFFTLQKGVSEK